MLVTIGAALVIGILLFMMIAAWHRRIGVGGIFVFGIIGIGAGIAVANLPRVASFAVQAGQNQSLSLQLQQVEQKVQQVTTQAQQVQTDVTEVRQIREQIEALAKRVEQGEQNVSQMHDTMQQTWRSLFESFAYIVSTRNLFPPPDFINQEINRHVNILAAFR